MGQKVHPTGFRLVVNKNWSSKWIANQEYADYLHLDLNLRKVLKDRLRNAAVSRIDIERAANKLKLNILTARPGIIIGKKGSEVEKLKSWISQRTNQDVTINIKEVKKPELEAQLIAESICNQLERRISFRRAMKKAEENALRFGAKGIKIKVSGRLNGAEIARSEEYLSGQMPLQTLRANVDYGFAEALTTYGIIGVKVWVNKG
ncbi:30S ribosomal protein S3 [Sulfidibacter corallicola]|uniref:Small ribosomal subunit protein uS3 n=1 Tax=Sulfidibacter corallicola TaxID=2818388 RepID=A0A8A4TGK9_SULCO|nr:30S ribosomal protein S3 [Sulfidibacter corallicola]QTD47858.1 30S ribosomal protein S3 [Sulfidibacter corallicola]